MDFINTFKIRRKNRREKEKQYQSKRSKCCESCKYCYVSEFYNGYENYSCFLEEKGFENDIDSIFTYKCNNYKPCRKYKKYLENKI